MIEISAQDFLSRFVVRGPAGGALQLPEGPNRAIDAGETAALWLGPDEWLLLGGAAPDTRLAVIDVSHRSVGVQLRGAEAVTLLAGGVPLDLRLAAFPVGMCTRTIFEKAEIILWRRGEADWHVEVPRSFAPYVRALMAAIADANGLATRAPP